MRKVINSIETSLKGTIIEFDGQTVTVEAKKGKESVQDTVDLQEFLADITKFMETNSNKNISFNCVLKLEE